MKILISVHTYYPDKNGVQMVTQYIAEGLAKKHEVKVITELKENYLRKEIYNNVSIERIKINSFDGKFTGEKNKYLSFIKDYNPKVLIYPWIFRINETLSHYKRYNSFTP